MVKIIDAMEREGMTEGQAVAAAQEALFDYSLVPNLVRSLRTRPIGAPFITFYYKAFPAVAKGAIKHPGKMAKYLIIPYLLGDALVFKPCEEFLLSLLLIRNLPRLTIKLPRINITEKIFERL